MKKDHNLLYRSWHKRLISLFSALLLLAALPGWAQETPVAKAPAAEQVSESEALNLGTEAYIYGYPLVIMATIQRVMINVAVPTGNSRSFESIRPHAPIS